jgi:putative ABC transport system substrate-binding protein
MTAQGADLVDKIIKGAKPAEFPVEQPTRYRLLINLSTAKTLSLNIPLSLQQAADEVIK